MLRCKKKVLSLYNEDVKLRQMARLELKEGRFNNTNSKDRPEKMVVTRESILCIDTNGI